MDGSSNATCEEKITKNNSVVKRDTKLLRFNCTKNQKQTFAFSAHAATFYDFDVPVISA